MHDRGPDGHDQQLASGVGCSICIQLGLANRDAAYNFHQPLSSGYESILAHPSQRLRGILKAEPVKLDIKRRESGILFISLPIVSLFKLAVMA